MSEFAQHLADCQAALLAYIFAMVQNMADAEDICQRVAIVLWNKYDEYQPGTSFVSWSLTTARFEALNFIRKRRRERLYFSEATVELLADAATPESSAAETRWSSLRHCMEKLPVEQRRLISLYYEGSETIAQVASRLGRTEQGARSALCRIRQSLRRCIEHTASQEAAR